MDSSMSCIITDSVISITRLEAASPVSFSARSTSPTSSGRWSWRAERFTAMWIGGDFGKVSWRYLACVQASRSTHFSMGTMSPVSSARGTKSSGRVEAAFRVLPPHEGFEPFDLAGLQDDDRLVVQDELVAVDRSLQVGLQLEAAQRGVVHRRFEHLVATLACFLRHVHRDVRVAQQLFRAFGSGSARVVRGRDTDRRADEHFLVLELERAFERGEDPRRDLGRLDAVGGVLEEDRELVATEPRSGVGRAQARLQPLADLTEHQVAGGVAERVVDRLEVVEVHEQHRNGVAAARLELERVLDAILEQCPVGEAGDGVVERLVRELLFERLPFGDIADVEHDAAHVLVVQQVRAHGLGVEPEIVLVTEAELRTRRMVVLLTCAGREELEDARLVLDDDEVDELASPRARSPGIR